MQFCMRFPFSRITRFAGVEDTISYHLLERVVGRCECVTQ